MYGFTKDCLDVRHRGGFSRRCWVVLDTFGFYSKEENLYVEVPRGFIHDFASVPKFARGIISTTGILAWAAVIHDYLYTVHKAWFGSEELPIVRDVADNVLYEATIFYLIKFGIYDFSNRVKAKTAYECVASFGQSSWDEEMEKFIIDL